MINKFKQAILLLLVSLSFFQLAICQNPEMIQVDVDHPKSTIQPTMWGVFFEDINFAADGGLYAEMIKNRSFEFATPKAGWLVEKASKDSSHFIIVNRGVSDSNPRYASIKINKENSGFSIINSGFRGMGVKENNTYYFSILASISSIAQVILHVELLDHTNKLVGSTSVNLSGKDWKKYESSISATKTDPKSKLRIRFDGEGTVNFDMVSLFPSDTWKNRKGGLRADLVQLLADLKPGFLRFPGGCIVEGRELATRYQWKKTVGPIEDRTLIVNRWNTEFKHRPTPDYYQTFGLGFYEYFLLAEDLGAEPLPILNCGMACQFNTAEIVPLEKLDPFVQDALDLIEFANGSADTKWGGLRSKMGHPEPFHIKYIGIGNEQWGSQYFERYAIFEKVLKEKYPEVKLVSGTGPFPNDELFHLAKKELKKFNPAIVDEHYYRPPSWFFENATRYDNYDRNTYKIFAGEYAAQSDSVCSPNNKNNWECALSEAAFMTGLERNADVVSMCSYAPLLAHTEGWQWTPDLIWFNNLNSYGTPNYHVQKLFSNNKGTDLLKMLQNGKPLIGQVGIFASAAWDKNSNEVILKIVNRNKIQHQTNIELYSKRKFLPKAAMTVLQSDDLNKENSMEDSGAIKPVTKEVTIKGKYLNLLLEPYSLSIVRIKQR